MVVMPNVAQQRREDERRAAEQRAADQRHGEQMAALTAQVKAAGSPPGRAAAGPDLMATLASLADLRDRGAITPEEYELKKRDIMARI